MSDKCTCSADNKTMKPILSLILTAYCCVAATKKPNVIFIISDDQSYETIRASPPRNTWTATR